jgi:hypothetical protein
VKEILNEWRKFVNEYEDFGEDYRIKSMEPVSYEEASDFIKASSPLKAPEGREFYKIEMTDGEEYVADYDPTSDPPLFVYNNEDQDMGEEFAEEALRYLNQDAPYDQERLPSEEPEDDLEEVAVSDFDKRSQQIAKIHDGFVDFLEVEDIFPMGEIPKSVMDALMNAAIVTADAMGGDLDERCQKGYKTHPTTKTKKMYGKTVRNCVKAEG